MSVSEDTKSIGGSSESNSSGCSVNDVVFTDENGKQPSWSANEVSGRTSPPPPSGSKARQKKFHRHFPQAAQEERVLNYYSCALVGDILLQGHLYITKNYFAFYSNVFGYVTKLLIPLASVIRVTKEKMARIIPNAVGVATLDDKHVFASLLSRDTTYKLMTEVWKESRVPIAESIPIPKELRLSKVDVEASEVSVDDESSICSQSGGEDVNTVAEAALSPSPEIKLPPIEHEEGVRIRTLHPNDAENVANNICGTLSPRSRAPLSPTSSVMSRRKVRSAKSETSYHYMQIAAVGFSILLVVSASLLFYKLQGKAASDTLEENLLLLKRGDDVYSEILKWHSQLHSKSAMQVHEFLHSNLDQISKVRQSLETLSTLIGGIITDKMKSPMDSNQGFITRNPEDEAGSRDNPGSARPPSDGES